MYANDGQRIFDAVTFAPLVLMGPLVLIGGVIYLLRVIGRWSLLGLAVFLVFDILQVYYDNNLLFWHRFSLASRWLYAASVRLKRLRNDSN